MAQLYWPFDPSIINYGFGYPPGYGGFHNGIDFPVSQGTELRATVSGTIRNVDAGQVDGAGVDIMTPDGWKVRSWHVSQFLKPHGSWVEAGEVFALSGGARGTWGAGNSTGAHLHWGVATDGRDGWVDPAGLNPMPFVTPQPVPVVRGKVEDMNLCHVPQPDGTLKFVLFNEAFYLEFVGQEAANAFASQIGGNSAGVSQSFLELVKAQVAKNQGK